MTEEIKTLLDEYGRNVKSFRDEVKKEQENLKKGIGRVEEHETKLSKINEALNKNEDAVKAIQAAADKAYADYEKTMQAMESKINRFMGGASGGKVVEFKFKNLERQYKDLLEQTTPEMRDADFITRAQLKSLYSGRFPDMQLSEDERKAVQIMAAVDRKALSTSNASSAGYLTQPEIAQGMIEYLVNTSPILQICKSQPTSKLNWVKRRQTGNTTAVFIGEGGTIAESTDPTVAAETLVIPRLVSHLKVTEEMLMDADTPIILWIRAEMQKAMDIAIGASWYSGIGGNLAFEGISTNAALVAADVHTGAAADWTNPDVIYDLFPALRDAYHRNARFYFNRTTEALLRKMRGSDGHELWLPMSGGTPASIAGKEYIIVADLALPTTANGYCLAFGDMAEAYSVVYRTSIRFRELMELYALTGYVGLVADWWIGGGVVNPYAIVLLKVAA